ncbi:ribosomal-processing cysteine protease Prp [Clostridium sp. WILCCON 0269]|uniref:Ribosomal processing cysteine protease Prp n=1 Tax=Candidatus Clostridium eludens TaxID=3381663 RepID=A0ABW8SJC5_9CLOT
MIEALFEKKSCNLISVELKGHAESVEQGYDLVCSAASAISQSIVIGITEVLKLNLNYSLKNGFLSFSLKDMAEDDILKCQVLMKTMLLGLKSIEVSFGEYISVKEMEV